LDAKLGVELGQTASHVRRPAEVHYSVARLDEMSHLGESFDHFTGLWTHNKEFWHAAWEQNVDRMVHPYQYFSYPSVVPPLAHELQVDLLYLGEETQDYFHCLKREA